VIGLEKSCETKILTKYELAQVYFSLKNLSSSGLKIMKTAFTFQQINFLLLPILIAQISLACASKQVAIAPPQTPDNLKVPAGQVLRLKGIAKGVQIYQCKAKTGNTSQFEWTLKAPEADLFDNNGKKIIKHYGGPTWEALDGSKVIGTVKAKADAPTTSAIPWLLVQAKSKQGNGSLSKVTYIQRVETIGGKAPSQVCNQAHANTEARIDYAADYFFYSPAP
jgi:hypothetical protein